jgi:NAD(P)-dependent dehydrogenase (short-subunit alcohol dehydrogenase family)
VKGIASSSAYNATKAAVRSFARTWTNELKDRHIRINTLSPGPIETPIFGKVGLTDAQITDFATAITGLVPLGRIGTADEIAKAAVFLASDDSSFVTGIDLQVDGGLAQV